MSGRLPITAAGADVRSPAVAGSFYPAEPGQLAALVDALLDEAVRLRETADPIEGSILGLLVPHAGLVYSGVVAATGWGGVARQADAPETVVILGTNHGAAWLDGVAAWEAGSWRTPLGDLEIDTDLAAAILGLGAPFAVDRAAHRGEHSIEIQLPFLQAFPSLPRIVPLSVAAGVGRAAIEAGARLGALLAAARSEGRRLVLAISSDMAHYPSSTDCALVTAELTSPIVRLDPAAVAGTEAAISDRGVPGLVCGMCGIQPTVLGLAALRAMGASHGSLLASATSADAGGGTHRTVGYLAAAFTAEPPIRDD